MDSLKVVPWYDHESDFAEVFRLLFTAEGNQVEAVQHIQAWMQRGGCPPNVESTAALLEAILLNNQLGTGSLSSFALRHCHASAIIRFVNAIVDPMQQSVAAKSISYIAAGLDLPQRFVDVRHAATHEEMPSLSLLQRTTTEALGWLYERYWLPNVNKDVPSTSNTPVSSAPSFMSYEALREHLDIQLKVYKNQQKDGLRDTSLFRPKLLDRQCRHIEQLALSAPTAVGSETDQVDEEELVEGDGPSIVDQAGGLQQLDLLLELLLEPGGLVPSHKKKLCGPKRRDLDPEIIDIWMPLLNHLRRNHSSFAPTLMHKLVQITTAQRGKMSEQPYKDTVQAWAVVLVDKWSKQEPSLPQSCLRACLHVRSQQSLSIAEHILSAGDIELDNGVSASMLLSLAKRAIQPVGLFDASTDPSTSSQRLQALEKQRALHQHSLVAEDVEMEAEQPKASPTSIKEEQTNSTSPRASSQMAFGSWRRVTMPQPRPIGSLPPGLRASALVLK